MPTITPDHARRIGYVYGLRPLPHDPVCPYPLWLDAEWWFLGFTEGRRAMRDRIMLGGRP